MNGGIEDTETLLIEEAEEHGFTAMRAPTSGARDNHETGDVWIVREHPWAESGTELFLIAERYKDDPDDEYVRIDGEKLDRMIKTAEKIEATPLVAARWSQRTVWSPGSHHWVGDAREIERTDEGNISVESKTAKSEWVATERWFRRRVKEAESGEPYDEG